MKRHSCAVPNATGMQAAFAGSSPSGTGQVMIAGTTRFCRVRAVGVEGDHLVADGGVLDAGADLDDRAGAEVADDVRGLGRWRRRAGEQIAALDADRLDVQQHAAVGTLRVGNVLVAQHVRGAVLVDDRCFDGAIVSLR